MSSMQRMVVVVAVLAVLLTTTVGVAAAAPKPPDDNANMVAHVAHTNQGYMHVNMDIFGTPANSYAKPPYGNGAWTSHEAHFWNGP